LKDHKSSLSTSCSGELKILYESFTRASINRLCDLDSVSTMGGLFIVSENKCFELLLIIINMIRMYVNIACAFDPCTL